jgi:hypothetical protein
MKHDWERAALCIYCATWCPNCNDCTCPGNGWKKYALSNCPGFDTHAGYDRPHKPERKRSEGRVER